MNPIINCVMLVDDDAANIFYCSIIINDAYPGIQIKTAQSVDAALDYLSKCDYMTRRETALPFPDLILLDINMPAKSGWDFLEYYKKRKDFFIKLPVIVMLSSSVDEEAKSNAETIPELAAVYEKPLTTPLLSSIIDKYFVYA